MPNVTKPAESSTAIESVIARGDLAALTVDQRLIYYRQVCDSLGLNPLTQPFAYISLNQKLCLYARKDATDQLRRNHKISVSIVKRERIEDVYVVTARAQTPEGRCDESTGAVGIGNAKGDTLANALMKAETKAKRRVTLSICGLGFLDETEAESIPGDRPVMDQSVPAAIEHHPAAADALEFESHAKRLDTLWSGVGACTPGYILERMAAWAREEMACELPMAQWPSEVLASGDTQLRDIARSLKERHADPRIGPAEQQQLAEMMARKGVLWSRIVRNCNLPANAASKDLTRAAWREIMAGLEEEPDAEPARN